MQRHLCSSEQKLFTQPVHIIMVNACAMARKKARKLWTFFLQKSVFRNLISRYCIKLKVISIQSRWWSTVVESFLKHSVKALAWKLSAGKFHVQLHILAKLCQWCTLSHFIHIYIWANHLLRYFMPSVNVHLQFMCQMCIGSIHATKNKDPEI